MNLGLGFTLNTTVIRAIVRRDLRMAFSNPTGYVFVTLFIFLSAAAAFWQDRFFQNNLANLDQLNAVFPLLLLFFIPALTMGVWASETSEGTDELLLTLPATDLEVVLGKYLATFGVYTASLLLSLSHILVLAWLGSPDYGLMIGNYLGYWLVGGSMIAVGMLASLLTANATIGFILGAIFCSVLVMIDALASGVSAGLRDMLSPLGIFSAFDGFARGIVSFSGILYFMSVTGIMLYLNVVLISRRHWPVEAGGYQMSVHHAARAGALVIAVTSFNAIMGWADLRLDVTAEQINSLSDETYDLIDEISADRPVFIQAFVSPEAPESYVQTRANLIDVLKEFDAIGADRVQVQILDTEPYTPEAQDARERFGIQPRELPNLGSPRSGFTEVFAGVAFICGPEEQVIEFMDPGLPVEYELARSIRVVARTERKKLGVLQTEARLFGGFDFQTMSSSTPWPVVDELRRQYEIVEVAPTDEITADIDALLVALPSTLSQEELDRLRTYIKAGNPTILLVDPLPAIDISLSPSEQAGANTNPFMRNSAPPPKEKGNIQELMGSLGVSWNIAQIIWDGYNPHPDLSHLPEEVVFVGAGNNNPDAFNEASASTAPLQELVFLFPGHIQPSPTADFDFQPLIQSGQISGASMYAQLVQRNFFGGAQLIPPRGPRRANLNTYTLAAHITGQQTEGDQTDSLNVVVVADLDFISQQFFDIRRMGIAGLNFDNVTFFLNAVDILMEDESFIALRSKRVKYRTLETVEAQTRAYTEQRAAEETQAEQEAQQALQNAQQRLTDRVNEVRQRADLDEQTKQIMVRNLEEVENRRFETLENSIKSEKDAKIQNSKDNMERQIRQIQNAIKNLATLLPPIPVFALGVWIFVQRRRREREAAVVARRLRN